MKPLKTLALIAAALPYTAFAENVPQPVQTSELQTVNVTGKTVLPAPKTATLTPPLPCAPPPALPCPKRNAAVGKRDYKDTTQRAGDYQSG